jgi:integrase
MGSVHPYETQSGRRYKAVWRKPDHSQAAKRGFKTKKAAELHLAEVEVAKASGTYIDASRARASVRELGRIWLSNRTGLKPSTLRPLEIAWRLHVEPRWGAVAVADVAYSDVQTWVNEMGRRKSPTTVLRAHSILAGILDAAVRDRRIAANPARGVDLPRKLRKAHQYLSHAELHRLADNAGRHRTLVLTLGYTGLRWGEATGLRVRDLDMLRRRILVEVNAVEVGSEIIVGTPKSHTKRSVPFPAFLGDLLAAACEGKGRDDLVFATSVGTHLRRVRTDGQKSSWFKSALVAAELEPMTPHDLRHTAASLAVSSGANVKAVQRMLGHASASMTLDVYADLFDDDLDAVATALDHAARTWIVANPLPLRAVEDASSA